MPELPDVEVFRRYIDSTSLHQKIESVEVRDGRILGGVSARKLQSALKGRTFESTRRHGKNLFVGLDDGGWLLMHFGMTGDLEYFEDQRMFGKVDLVEDLESFVREKKLGPDSLELDPASFRERFEGRKGSVKAALMNQQVVAGVGNIYSDEILFQARLHPETRIEQLDDATLERLFEETRRVLETAIERGAYPQELPDNFLLSHRREGERCPRGNGEIRKLKAAGRTAYYCPACQPEAR